jgi:ribonucleoside-diphosphate reductase alpha chain
MVTKRDGRVVEWDAQRIFNACRAAGASIEDALAVSHMEPRETTVEQISNEVERQLMARDTESAKRYILYREERAKAREYTPNSRELSNYIFAAKYAREVDGCLETFDQAVDRVAAMHKRRYPQISKEIDWAFQKVKEGLVLPSMRSLQFGGEAIEKNHARLYNCSFSHVSQPEFYQMMFYLLLSGCGVGASVQKHHVDKLPEVSTLRDDLVIHDTVEDTIEGWAASVGLLFLHAFDSGAFVEFNYSEIRDEGERLRTSGGKAPGHIPLRVAIEKLRGILRHAAGRKLRPIECFDMMCILAEGVLSGGIRRSSLITLFSPDDNEMMMAKHPDNFQHGGKNNHRQMSNNSPVLLRNAVNREDIATIVKSSLMFGEPGLYLTDNLEWGCNPCGEIGLNPVFFNETGFAFCNLTEINGAKCVDRSTLSDAARAASIIGTVQAGYTEFDPFMLNDATKHIAQRDALIGVSITGFCDSPDILLDSEALSDAAEIVVATNELIAKAIGINTAARCTTVKPSGTASLVLGGVANGIHPHHHSRYIRRVTANSNENLAQEVMRLNPHAVEVKPNGDLSICFPTMAPEGALIKDNIDAIGQLQNVALVYKHWIMPGTTRGPLTHNVSCTISVGDDEVDGVVDWIMVNTGRITAVSFFGKYSDQNIPFIPLQSIRTSHDLLRWTDLVRKWVPVDYTKIVLGERSLDAGCSGGVCKF